MQRRQVWRLSISYLWLRLKRLLTRPPPYPLIGVQSKKLKKRKMTVVLKVLGKAVMEVKVNMMIQAWVDAFMATITTNGRGILTHRGVLRAG